MRDPAQRISRDLSCPRCDYNLRGLEMTSVVVCPECGDGWDSAALLGDASPSRPTRLLGDIVVITIISGECLLIAPLAVFGLDFSRGLTAPIVGVGFILLVWLAACHAFCQQQRGYVRGLWLLAHVVLALSLLFGGALLIPRGVFPGVHGWPTAVVVGVVLAAWAAGGAVLRRALVLSRRDERIAQSRASRELPDPTEGDA